MKKVFQGSISFDDFKGPSTAGHHSLKDPNRGSFGFGPSYGELSFNGRPIVSRDGILVYLGKPEDHIDRFGAPGVNWKKGTYVFDVKLQALGERNPKAVLVQLDPLKGRS